MSSLGKLERMPGSHIGSRHPTLYYNTYKIATPLLGIGRGESHVGHGATHSLAAEASPM